VLATQEEEEDQSLVENYQLYVGVAGWGVEKRSSSVIYVQKYYSFTRIQFYMQTFCINCRTFISYSNYWESHSMDVPLSSQAVSDWSVVMDLIAPKKSGKN